MFFQIAAFVIGVIISFLIGFLETCLLRLKIEKCDKILVSFGLGNVTVVFILFLLNQYFGILLTGENILISVSLFLVSLAILCFIKKIDFLEQLRSLLHLEKIKVNKVFLLLLVIFYLLCFYKAMLFPETNWDSIYGFSYWPKVVWQEHSLPIVSSSYHESGMAGGNQNFPVLLNNYFFSIYGNFDEFFIRILIPLWSLLNVLLVYRLSRILFKSDKISMLSSVFFISTNVFSAYSVFTLASVYELFYPLLAIYVYVLYEKNDDKSLFILSSVLLGITLSMKYVWIPLFFTFIVSMIIVKKEIKKPVIMSVIAALISLLFYLRNILFYHNPFFPLFFGGEHYNDFLFKIFWKGMMTPDFTNLSKFFDTIFKTNLLIWAFFLFFGIYMLRNSPKIHKILYVSALLYIPIFIASSAFLPTTDGQRHLLPYLAIMSIFAGSFFWNFVENIKKNSSNLFVSLPFVISFFVLLAGIAFNVMGNDLLVLIALPPMVITPLLFIYKSNKISQNKLIALIIISLMITPIVYVSFMKRVKIWEFPSEEEVILRYWDDIYTTGKYINKNLPEDAKIFSLENRRYYFDREIIPADRPDMIFDYQNQTLDHVLKELYDRGIHFILINQLWKDKGLWDYSTIHQNADTLNTSKNVDEIFQYKNITLYKIVYE